MFVNKTVSTPQQTAMKIPATSVKGANFADAEKVAAYRRQLEAKFGSVTVENVGRDQESLEAVGKRMNGRDIIIAPNILAEMATDQDKAAYYEQKIRYFFTNVIPEGIAFSAAMGLTFQPGGVVIHPDGTVTYVCGGEDSPERRTQVEAENRAKWDKRIANNRRRAEQAQEQAIEQHLLEMQQVGKLSELAHSLKRNV